MGESILLGALGELKIEMEITLLFLNGGGCECLRDYCRKTQPAAYMSDMSAAVMQSDCVVCSVHFRTLVVKNYYYHEKSHESSFTEYLHTEYLTPSEKLALCALLYTALILV